jgi:tRNA 2-selenouridine synthase
MIYTVDLQVFLRHAQNTPIVDVRSQNEYQRGHIPGSLNIPLLNNEQRTLIGTLYKQSGKEAAVLKGLQLVGPHFYELFKQLRKASKDRKLLVYCWRGGLRSNIMAWLMSLADYDLYLLQGGYKAWRAEVAAINAQPRQWIILSGRTGCGKTETLRHLKAMGEQVLDLEHYANHRGSAFGQLGLAPQPTVEHFENLLAAQLRQFNAQKPVWAESESRFIGKVRIPDAMYNQLMHSPIIEIAMDIEVRKQRIWQEYGNFDVQDLIKATLQLERKLGGDRTKVAVEALKAGDWNGWLDILLQYYDKTYSYSLSQRRGTVVEFVAPGISPCEWCNELIQKAKTIWMQQH